MEIHLIRELLAQIKREGKAYLEFVRVADLSVGVYRLGVGEVDGQRPHAEDEVYFVVEGRGKFWEEGVVREVGKGAVIFVRRGVEHRFVEIEEEMVLLVFFGPAEGTRRG